MKIFLEGEKEEKDARCIRTMYVLFIFDYIGNNCATLFLGILSYSWGFYLIFNKLFVYLFD